MLDTTALIDSLNLEKQSPPYSSVTFTLWRQQQFKKFDLLIKHMKICKKLKWLQKFSKLIDNDLENKFFAKTKKAYHDNIFFRNYQVPSNIKVDEIKKKYRLFDEMEQLTNAMSDWFIEIEKCQDIIERCKVYSFYQEENNAQEEIDKLVKFDEKQMTQSIKKTLTLGLK